MSAGPAVDFSLRHLTVSGQRIGYRLAGEGPPLVLIHGLASSSTTWRVVGPILAEEHQVLAVDLLGHGESAKPRGDYSLGAQASMVRDVMVTLGVEQATFVGHSLGGGVALQLAYQFPSRCQRLALVATGGLGPEISPLLRAVSLPGAELVLPLLLSARRHAAVGAVGRALRRRVGLRLDDTRAGRWEHDAALASAAGRAAFVSTVREVIDLAGQRVSARDKLYLAAALPTLLVWGDNDAVIPVAHAYAAHQALPASRLEILAGAGHFLPLQNGPQLAAAIADFVATTEPAPGDELAFQTALRRAAATVAVEEALPVAS